jgi:hypothetical protein
MCGRVAGKEVSSMSDTVAVALIAAGSSALGAVGGALVSYLAVLRTQRTEVEKLRVGFEHERKAEGEHFKHGKRMAYKEFVIKAEKTSVDPDEFEGSDDVKELGKLYNTFLFSAPRAVIDLAEAYRATWASHEGRPVGDPQLLKQLKDAMLEDVKP